MVDREIALARKRDTLVESSIVHLPFVGQVGPIMKESILCWCLSLSNISSWIVEDISLPKSELENLSILSMPLITLTLLLPLVKLDHS